MDAGCDPVAGPCKVQVRVPIKFPGNEANIDDGLHAMEVRWYFDSTASPCSDPVQCGQVSTCGKAFTGTPVIDTDRAVFTATRSLALVLFQVNAQGPGEAARAERRIGTRDEPRPPEEFRVLGASELTEAVPLLQELLSGVAGLEARAELAAHYRDTGFWGAADFFEETMRVARGEEITVAPVESPIAWSARAEATSDRPAEVAERVATWLREGDADRALAEAEAFLENEGPSLQVVVQWADAVLWKAAVEPAAVSPEALEAAARVYLTSLTEKAPLPLGVGSRAGGYARLSTVFQAVGDPLSALTASLLGIQQLGARFQAEDPGTAVREMLCSEAEALAHRLGMGPEGWPEDRAYSVCRTVKR